MTIDNFSNEVKKSYGWILRDKTVVLTQELLNKVIADNSHISPMNEKGEYDITKIPVVVVRNTTPTSGGYNTRRFYIITFPEYKGISLLICNENIACRELLMF